MVNLLTAVTSIIQLILKFYGLTSQTVEIEPGTWIHFWAPPPPSAPPGKPVLLFLHGFGASAVLMWLFQVMAFSKDYHVVVPDLLFFGGSTTRRRDRSPAFQARCLARALREAGVERCAAAVGCSYGGIVLAEMAAAAETAELVGTLVLSNSDLAMTESRSAEAWRRFGVGSWAELLLPETVSGLKRLLGVVTYRRFWFPDWAYSHFLEVMFEDRGERAELLRALVIKDEEFVIPEFSQKICIIAGEEDQIFNIEHTMETKAKLGDKATLHSIKKAGHLIQIERPFLYNHLLKNILEGPL